MKKKSPIQVKSDDLPPDVKEADLKYPKWDENKSLSYQEQQDLGIETTHFTFYKVAKTGWVLTTLLISKTSKSDRQDRYYAVGMDGKVWRVGKGPHVEKTIVVYLSKDNLERLTKYVDLWKVGASQAGQIRDRISSRRAQGQIYRAEGRTHWNW